MKLLKDRILSDGVVLDGGVLNVDGFLNHKIDVVLLNEIGKEFARIFKDEKITKIMTIEASGIAVAAITAQYFNNVPVVYAKKVKSALMSKDVYSEKVQSFTANKIYDIYVSKNYISSDDRILIIDDFLARGCALKGLIEIIKTSGAELVGAGIAIEKKYMHGGDKIREKGIRVESLASIESIDAEKGITFN